MKRLWRHAKGEPLCPLLLLSVTISLKLTFWLVDDCYYSTTPNHVETHSIPGLEQLVNYPNFLSKSTYATSQRGRHCVMCGELRPYSSARVRTLPSTLAYTPEKESEVAHFIPARNKNVCTACDEIVWRVVECNLDIKFCRLCYNFCPLDAFFGDARSKGRGRNMTKTCINCRRLKYWRLKWVAAATRKP